MCQQNFRSFIRLHRCKPANKVTHTQTHTKHTPLLKDIYKYMRLLSQSDLISFCSAKYADQPECPALQRQMWRPKIT